MDFSSLTAHGGIHVIFIINIDKGITDHGVDCFNQSFWVDLVGLVWFGRFGSEEAVSDQGPV